MATDTIKKNENCVFTCRDRLSKLFYKLEPPKTRKGMLLVALRPARKVLIIKLVELEKPLFEFNLNCTRARPTKLWTSKISRQLPAKTRSRSSCPLVLIITRTLLTRKLDIVPVETNLRSEVETTGMSQNEVNEYFSVRSSCKLIILKVICGGWE